MSRIYDALRRAETRRGTLREDPKAPAPQAPAAGPRGFDAVAVVSNKGGVGKTTFATNLAIELRARCPERPVLLVSLDDELWVERMFALEGGRGNGGASAPDIAAALRAGSFEGAIREGRHGVHFVAPSRQSTAVKAEIRDPFHLERMLGRSGWRGLVVIDTKSDLEVLTRNALAASDLAVVVVKDQASLLEAERVFELLAGWGRAPDRARVLLSLVDLRVAYREGESRDVLALLLSEIRRRGWPVFQSFVSRSPEVEALATHPGGRPLAVREAAPEGLVARQLAQLGRDVLAALAPEPPAAAVAPLGERAMARVARTRRWLLGETA